jgi:RNA polymerase sigma factor (sigma-70 family)
MKMKRRRALGRSDQPQPLSNAQQALVRENLALVGVHLRKHFAEERRRPDRPEYLDDLFQDGCLGLIDAARTYDPAERGGFAPYAMYRIHQAVTRSLRRIKSSVRLPERAARRRPETRHAEPDDRRSPRAKPDTTRRMNPCVTTLPADVLDKFPSRNPNAEHPAIEDAARPGDKATEALTIGDILRSKVQAAIRMAMDRIEAEVGTWTDAGPLVRLLVEDYVLVPEDFRDLSLRTLAEKASVPYSRVLQCEVAVREMIRDILDGEAEIRLLREVARREPLGLAMPVNRALDGQLRHAAALQYEHVFRSAPPNLRGWILLALAEALGVDYGALFRALARRQGPSARTAWLAAIRAADHGSGWLNLSSLVENGR